jgi:ketosteroid isomerase-like protein
MVCILLDRVFYAERRESGRKEDAVTEQRSAGGLDFEAARRAIEQRDADSLINLYADDAELRRIDRNSTPSSPMVLRGKQEIAEYWRDVFGREMAHHVQDEVLGEERVAFKDACEYPDGTRVLGADTLDVRDGKIVRHVSVQAWDE